MGINLGSNFTQRYCEWNLWKNEHSVRGGAVQYDDEVNFYTVWFYDGSDVLWTTVHKGMIPDTELALGKTQEDCNLIKSEFENLYKPLSNRKIAATQKDKASLVAIVGREGSETIWSTHNFADPTTWYGQSLRTMETLVNSGDSLRYTSSHANWIDMEHGKIFDEDSLKEDISHGYSINVTVNGIPKTQVEPLFEDNLSFPGDYIVDYNLGHIIFREPQPSGAVVVAEYSYENGSVWLLKPMENKTLDIEQAEIQFSKNVEFNDTIEFKIYGLVDVFAPEMVGPIPSGQLIEIEKTSYKTIFQMIDEALGSYPTIPAIGGSSGRGSHSEIYGFPFTYNAVRRLDSRYGLELRVGLKHNIKFNGDRATGTFYCVSRNVEEL